MTPEVNIIPPESAPPRLAIWSSRLFLVLLCLMTGLLYSESMLWLYREWSGGKTYSHGFLVPLISIYLLWEQRQRLRKVPINPSPVSGLAIIVPSLFLLFAARAGAVIQLEALSFFCIIPGIVLLVWGGKMLRAIVLPWLYLLFMFPVWGVFLKYIEYPSQRFSAFLGAKILSLFYPVYRDAIYIHLPSIHMEVARECSGISFLVAVMAIGIPLVYLTQRSWRKAVFVLLSGCILTLLANGFRVATAGVLGQNFGPEMLHGPRHILQGWFVAWIGWGGIFLVNWMVARCSDKSLPCLSERWQKDGNLLVDDDKLTESTSRGRVKFYGVIAALFFILLISVRVMEPQPVGVPSYMGALPKQFGVWQGTDEKWFDSAAFFPNTDSSIERVYHSRTGEGDVYLFVGYYAKQTEKARLVSQYSRPLHKKAIQITLEDSSDRPKVNQGILFSQGQIYDIVFWYQLSGHANLVERNEARLAALKTAITHHRNNGSVVIVAKPQKTSPENEENSQTVLRDFSQKINSSLR